MKTAAFIFFITLVFFVGCNVNNRKEASSDCEEMRLIEMDSVILSKELRESLLELVLRVHTIPNPFGRSVCYSLSFYKEEADTLLSIEANVYFPEILEKEEVDYEVKGLFSVHGHEVALYDYIEPIGNIYYDKNKLIAAEIMPPKDSLLKPYSNSYMGWTFVSPYILYKIRHRNLIRIDSYFGK